jgi:hypothetical protein
VSKIYLISVLALIFVVSEIHSGGLRRSRSGISLPKRRVKAPEDYYSRSDKAPAVKMAIKIMDEPKKIVKKEPISLEKLKVKRFRQNDLAELNVVHLDHLIASTLDVFDDDVQVEQNLAEQEYQKDLLQKFGKKLDNHETAPLYVGWVNSLVGHGVFADNKIEKGQFVGECTGRIVYSDKAGPADKFLFYYPSASNTKQFVISAQKEGNLLRFINHASNSNVEGEFVYHKGLWRLAFIATKNIEAGEQLGLDYGPDFWKGQREPLPL